MQITGKTLPDAMDFQEIASIKESARSIDDLMLRTEEELIALPKLRNFVSNKCKELDLWLEKQNSLLPYYLPFVSSEPGIKIIDRIEHYGFEDDPYAHVGTSYLVESSWLIWSDSLVEACKFKVQFFQTFDSITIDKPTDENSSSLRDLLIKMIYSDHPSTISRAEILSEKTRQSGTEYILSFRDHINNHFDKDSGWHQERFSCHRRELINAPIDLRIKAYKLLAPSFIKNFRAIAIPEIERDLLSTALIDTPDIRRVWDYSKAQKFVEKLGLETQEDWNKYVSGVFTNLRTKPEGVPSHPHIVYRDQGWINWNCWLSEMPF